MYIANSYILGLFYFVYYRPPPSGTHKMRIVEYADAWMEGTKEVPAMPNSLIITHRGSGFETAGWE